MLVGMRINASMLLGTILAWMVAPYLLMRYGVIAPTFTRTDVLFWVMWPATAMMVAGGLTALALRWRLLKKTFPQAVGRSRRRHDVSAAVGGRSASVIPGVRPDACCSRSTSASPCG